MAQALDEDDQDDGDGDDDSVDEDPLESDQDPDDDEHDAEESVPCPFCKKPIHEDADVCPKCGNYVGAIDAPRRLPVIVWIGAALALLGVLAWFLR